MKCELCNSLSDLQFFDKNIYCRECIKKINEHNPLNSWCECNKCMNKVDNEIEGNL